MSRKVLFVIPGLKHGGTNRSLINLVSLLDKNKYDISIYSMSKGGYYSTVFNAYNILETDFLIWALISDFRQEKKMINKSLLFVIKFFLKVLSYLGVKTEDLIYKFVAKKNKFLQFETIIAFQEGGATQFVSHSRIKNKVAWVHCNYKEYISFLNIKPEKFYKNFNKIVCVSSFTKNIFCELIPELQNKVEFIYNVLDEKKVKEMARVNPEKKTCINTLNESINLISIGRVDHFKRFSEIPKIASGLKKEGVNFFWYILGGVNHQDEMKKLSDNITQYNVKDNVVYLGEVDNPYPYISNSTLLINTSSSEAFPYVVLEAKVLGIPSIITDFGSAKECINDKIEGFIVPLEVMQDKIIAVLNDQKIYENLKSNLKNFQQDYYSLLSKVEQILN